MNQDFHHREQAVKQSDKRHRVQLEKHQTLETWQIEQDAAQEGSIPPVQAQPGEGRGLLNRLKRMFGAR